MAIRTHLYPLNFSFTNEYYPKHLHIRDFANQLQHTELWDLHFSNGELILEFKGVFSNIGLRPHIFDVTSNESARSVLKILTKTIQRRKSRPTYEQQRMPRDFIIDALRNEASTTPIAQIINEITALIILLRETVQEYLSRTSESDLLQNFVSFIIFSAWVSDWFSKRQSTRGPWDQCTYDGTVIGLRSKLYEFKNFRSQKQQLFYFVPIEFPLIRYHMLKTMVVSEKHTVRFNNYSVNFLGSHKALTATELQRIVDTQNYSLIHILPHYLVHHVHVFNTRDDMVRYLEWSVFRSQKEVNSLTSSVKSFDGIRFTRGALINMNLDPYIKFLNFLLWNSFSFEIPTTSDDYIEWHGRLLELYNSFHTPMKDYGFKGRYPVPYFVRNYVETLFDRTNQFSELNTIIEMYLEITYPSSLPDPIEKTLGRSQQVSVRGLVTTFNENPTGKRLDVEKFQNIRFIQMQIEPESFIQTPATPAQTLIGATSIPILTTGKQPPVPFDDVLHDIKQIRLLESVRSLIKKVAPFDVNSYIRGVGDSVLNTFKPHTSYWLALLLVSVNSRIRIDEVTENPVETMPITAGLEATISENIMSNVKLIKINNSTPKLLSVLDTLYHLRGGLSGARIPISLETIQREMSRVFILGSVGSGDPLGAILRSHLKSTTREVGAFGAGRVTRAEVSQFPFSLGFSGIFSDLDFGDIETEDDLVSFLDGILILYLDRIQPLWATWKINYASSKMIQYILNHLVDNFQNWRKYSIYLITPQYGRVENFEKYLTFIRRTQPFDNQSLGLLHNDLLQLNIPSFNERFDIEEYQCSSLGHYMDGLGARFPRMYYMISISENHLRSALTLLSHRSSDIQIAKNGGSPNFSLVSLFDPVRYALCSRLPGISALSDLLADRFNPSTFLPSVAHIRRRVKILNLSNYWRELSRLTIMSDIWGTHIYDGYDLFTTRTDDYHYIGIGDERVRNIILIPQNSPYTIYDTMIYDNYNHFNITYTKRPFPLQNLVEMKKEFQLQLNAYPDRKLVVLLTFVIFNAVETEAEMIEIVGNLAQACVAFKGSIAAIYFNLYLKTNQLPNPTLVPLNTVFTLFSDVQIEARDAPPTYYGTLSKNYNLVQLVSTNLLTRAVVDFGAQLHVLSPSTADFSFLSWNQNISMRPEDAGAIDFLNNFCPIFKIST